ADADGGRGLRYWQNRIVESAGDEFAESRPIGRDAEFDGSGHRGEHLGIETCELGLLDIDMTEAGQRADERRRAPSRAFELGLQGQPAGRGRSAGGWQERAEL